jgi:hypothetical protein
MLQKNNNNSKRNIVFNYRNTLYLTVIELIKNN